MSDFALVHRPALDAAPLRRSDAFAMRAMPEGTLLQILGEPGGEDLLAALRHLSGGDANAVRTFGPDQWLVVTDQPTSHSDLQAYLARFVPRAFGIDQSHGRIRIEVSGRAVTSVLAKGTAIDFDGMTIGQSAMTLMGHISVHLTRTEPGTFELIVLRGFAESLWNEIAEMAAEFL